MDKLKICNEELDKAIEYVRNNQYKNQRNDSQTYTYYKASLRSIRGDIKRANRYMYEEIDELSKSDIKNLLGKIIEIENNI